MLICRNADGDSA